MCAAQADRAGTEGACHLRTAAPPIAPAWAPDPRAAAAALLGVPVDADTRTVKKAARAKLFVAHRDRGGSDEASRRLIEARDLLLGSR